MGSYSFIIIKLNWFEMVVLCSCSIVAAAASISRQKARKAANQITLEAIALSSINLVHRSH